MTLANYINDLLYRYDCVIVPNFGGFITNKISAKVCNTANIFYPPTKQVSFNSHLKHNDGLLANYIVSTENISFEKANQFITNVVAKWKEDLQTSSVAISSIGSLSFNDEKQLIFEPNSSTNFLTSSFGLASVESSEIQRFKQEVKPLQPVVEVEESKTDKKGIPAFIKYAATAAILLTLGVAGYNAINQNQQQQILSKQQQQVEQKIQEATFVIDTPLPTINLSVAKKNAAAFYVIAGAFQLQKNAEKKVKQLERKGLDAKIIGKNKWGLIQVSVGNFSDELEARKVLEDTRKADSNDAWLLVESN